MIDHTSLVQAIAGHVDGSKPLTKERKATVLAVLGDPAEKQAVTAAMKAAWPALKAALQTALDNAAAGVQTDETKARRLSANEQFRKDYEEQSKKRHLEQTVRNAARSKTIPTTRK